MKRVDKPLMPARRSDAFWRLGGRPTRQKTARQSLSPTDWKKVSFSMRPLLLFTLLACSLPSLVLAQLVPAIKESGQALAELAKEGGDEIKAAVEKQPAKVIDKSKAQMHKANAHEHAHRAKAAAKSTFN
jgi:hypothetical protein